MRRVRHHRFHYHPDHPGRLRSPGCPSRLAAALLTATAALGLSASLGGCMSVDAEESTTERHESDPAEVSNVSPDTGQGNGAGANGDQTVTLPPVSGKGGKGGKDAGSAGSGGGSGQSKDGSRADGREGTREDGGQEAAAGDQARPGRPDATRGAPEGNQPPQQPTKHPEPQPSPPAPPPSDPDPGPEPSPEPEPTPTAGTDPPPSAEPDPSNSPSASAQQHSDAV